MKTSSHVHRLCNYGALEILNLFRARSAMVWLFPDGEIMRGDSQMGAEKLTLPYSQCTVRAGMASARIIVFKEEKSDSHLPLLRCGETHLDARARLEIHLP